MRPHGLFIAGMLVVMALAFADGASRPLAQEVENSCVSCHQDLGAEFAELVQNFQADIHAERGLSCQDCHGGNARTMDMEVAMDPAQGFVGAPADGRALVMLCGSCHSNAEYMHNFDPGLRIDQLEEYRSSVHGKRLFGQGDPNVATCVSCHGVHGIRAVRDPRSSVYPTRLADTCASCHADEAHMKPYGIPTDQYQEYRTSVHADLLYRTGDIGAPTCNDCHGNHGAAPPGGGSVANVCGQCHVFFKEYFLKSPHREPFESIGQCTHCHGNHAVQRPTDDWIGVGPQAVCARCHEPGDAGYKAAEEMHERITDLDRVVTEVGAILDRAERAGMQVSQPRFDLRDANESLVKARSLIHTLDPARVDDTVKEGLEVAGKVEEKGNEALEEIVYRRKGLLLSLVLILGLMAAMLWKIHELKHHPA